MKKFLLFFAALFFFSAAQAQLNMELRGQVQFNNGNLNDVWGWHHEPTGKEYALVGRTVGTSVVEVTDPDNPVEVGFFPGATTTWRDIKTWGDYAYVTNEQDLGVAVLYLGDLPSGGELTGFNWTPNIEGLGTLQTCHNIYIDEFGYAYLAGCNLNNGGMLIIDVFSEPGNPEFVSAAPAVYSHDVYTRDNLMYSSEIYAGVFTVYDVSDKQNIQALGNQETPFSFTHNAWLSDDGNYLFTTDELANAPIGSYDVSDPSDIVELDQFAPLETIGSDVIPHNVHVWDDYLIISYYTDGGIIADASEPDNIIEVGNLDTYFAPGAGFNGVWGAYPFLPSGTVLLTDIGSGLFVVTPTYVRAARIEGTVTDINTGAAITGANVEIIADQLNATQTDFTGEYKTGLATAGTYDVVYSAPGYVSETVTLNFENDVILVQDVQLGQLPTFSFSGATVEAADGAGISDAEIAIFNEDFNFEATSDADGNFSLSNVAQGSYTVIAGKWGYYYGTADVDLSADGNVTIELERGFQDDFVFDYEWNTFATSPTGQWERGVPNGTTFQGDLSNPDADVNNDLGNQAYVTGNGGGQAGNDDVDDGNVVLVSPPMDLTFMGEPVISYRLWFVNEGGNGGTPNDEISVSISNGTETVELQNVSNSIDAWRQATNFPIADLLEITDNMTVIVETADVGEGHLVEGGFDKFLVTDANPPSAVYQPVAFNVSLTAAPNPFAGITTVDYLIDTDFAEATFSVYNQLGQVVESVALQANTGTLRIGENLAQGVYFGRLEADGVLLATEKIVKTK